MPFSAANDRSVDHEAYLIGIDRGKCVCPPLSVAIQMVCEL